MQRGVAVERNFLQRRKNIGCRFYIVPFNSGLHNFANRFAVTADADFIKKRIAKRIKRRQKRHARSTHKSNHAFIFVRHKLFADTTQGLKKIACRTTKRCKKRIPIHVI